MAVATEGTAERIFELARQLPPESLADLVRFVEFLRFRDNIEAVKQPSIEENLLVSLEGILADYDVSPEALAEARREMWQNVGDIEL